jgi:hypothetical protein
MMKVVVLLLLLSLSVVVVVVVVALPAVDGTVSSPPPPLAAGSLRAQFESNFHARCDKYRFVHEFYHKLEHPPQRYLFFSYHDRGLLNGGFGDRMGGLVSAVMQSLRFNRTLVVKASNGMHELFRPYHPNDLQNKTYLWSNWKHWSQFAQWKASLPPERPYGPHRRLYEHDLTDCVSNSETGFSEAATARCALDDGDVSEPVLCLASNRAYLCRHAALPLMQQLLLPLPLPLNDSHPSSPSTSPSTFSSSSSKSQSDLFEAAGCMLRLAMWPTDRLWALVDEAAADLLRDTVASLRAQALLTDNEDNNNDNSNDNSNEKKETMVTANKKMTRSSKHSDTENSKKRGKSKDKKKKNQKKKKTKKTTSSFVADSTDSVVDLNGELQSLSLQQKQEEKEEKEQQQEQLQLQQLLSTSTSTQWRWVETGTNWLAAFANGSFTSLPQPPLLMGLHFRCGDRWSYSKYLLHTDGHSRFACVANGPDDIGDTGDGEHQKSIYLRAGNPAGIGRCAKELIEFVNVNKNRRKWDFCLFLFLCWLVGWLVFCSIFCSCFGFWIESRSWMLII